MPARRLLPLLLVALAAAPTVRAATDAPRPAGVATSTVAEPRRVLETLREMAPRARRIGVVYDPAQTGPLVEEAQVAARALGLELVALPARSVGEAVRAYYRFEKELQADALWLLPDGTTTVQETVYYALELAHWRRMVLIGVSRWYVASGALFALVPRPAGAEYDLYVNSRTAARLGLKADDSFDDIIRQYIADCRATPGGEAALKGLAA